MIQVSNTNDLEVLYTTQADFNPAKVFEVEVTRKAIDVATSGSIATASQTYLLTMADICIYDKITLGAMTPDFTHTIS